MVDRDVMTEIEDCIRENEVVLFMKGIPEAPMCGFSKAVVSILKKIEKPFSAINVLDDYDIREGIKKFSNWPTIPQLYVRGEFIGGCDIVNSMYKTGELAALFKESVE